MIGAIIALASLNIFSPQLEWRISQPQCSRTGDVVTVTLTRPGTAMIAADVDLSPWAGKRLRATIRSRGTNVRKAAEVWLGYKFMFHYTNARTGHEVWPGAVSKSGTWDWTESEMIVDLRESDPQGASLSLGLQATVGTVDFDLSSLTFSEALPLFEKDADTTSCAYSDHIRDMPLHRGVMLPADRCREVDFQTLKAWGATLARYQIVRRWSQPNDNQDVNEYLKWVDSKIDHLVNDVLPWAEKYGLRIVVDLHVAPGGRDEDGDMNMFYEPKYADAFLSAWTNISSRCRGRKAVFGYDLINEPAQRRKGAPMCDCWTLQARAARAVRKIDPVTPIMLESNLWDSPREYPYMKRLDLPDVIYQVHMYEPHSYTHQGVNAKDSGWKRVAYPSHGLNKESLRRMLGSVREFQKRHNAIIYVGEFSAIAWAEGADRYIGDCISIFEEFGWHWTYHAFREWDGWSVEHEATKDLRMRPSADNPRRRTLLRGLRGELSPSMSDAERHHSTEMNKTEVSADGVGHGDVRLLVLGNSIALHGVAPHLGWTNAWGMAASSANRDFAHLVAQGLERRLGKTVDLRIRNLYGLESDVSGYDIRSRNDACWIPDVVVIAIGENVQEKDVPLFGDRLVELGNLYRKANQKAQIVYRTVFWPNAAKDARIKEAASKVQGALLADIGGLGSESLNTAKGRFRHPGVAAHPGDVGMRRIAEKILSALESGVNSREMRLVMKRERKIK